MLIDDAKRIAVHTTGQILYLTEAEAAGRISVLGPDAVPGADASTATAFCESGEVFR